MEQLSASELACLFNIKKYTIRHYIDVGLLSPEKNSENGYYTFNEDDIYKLYQVIVFRNIGYSIANIKSILAQDNILKQLKVAENKIQSQIDDLQATKTTVQKIINAQEKYEINNVVFIERGNRYFKKMPSNILDGQNFKYTEAIKKKFNNFDNIYYITSNSLEYIAYYANQINDYDFCFSKGTYACKSFFVENEDDIYKEIEVFLSDPLLKMSPEFDKFHILCYENIFCSLAYNKVTVFSIEVRL